MILVAADKYAQNGNRGSNDGDGAFCTTPYGNSYTVGCLWSEGALKRVREGMHTWISRKVGQHDKLDEGRGASTIIRVSESIIRGQH